MVEQWSPAAGLACYRQGDYAEARERLTEALALFREIGDEEGAGHALNNLGVAALAGNYDEARQRFEEVMSVRRSLRDQDGIAKTYLNLSNVALQQGD